MRGVKALVAIALLIYQPFFASFADLAFNVASVTDRVTRTVTLRAGEPIRVDATIADLTITGSNRPDVQIEIVGRGPRAGELAKYPALIESGEDALHVSAVQAEDGRDAQLKSQITIRAPSGALFQSVRVFEGKITLSNLTRA